MICHSLPNTYRETNNFTNQPQKQKQLAVFGAICLNFYQHQRARVVPGQREKRKKANPQPPPSLSVLWNSRKGKKKQGCQVSPTQKMEEDASRPPSPVPCDQWAVPRKHVPLKPATYIYIYMYSGRGCNGPCDVGRWIGSLFDLFPNVVTLLRPRSEATRKKTQVKSVRDTRKEMTSINIGTGCSAGPSE